MKKIFTLIAAALMAVGANAMEDIDLTKIKGFEFGKSLTLGEWDWQGATISTGELVVDNDAKTADDSGVTYFDASAYDYIVIYYSACQGNVLLLSQYNCLGTVGQWGAEFNQESVTVDPTSEPTYAALKLNPDLKNKINQVVLQGGAGGGSITVDAAWFMTEAEWEEVKPEAPTTKPFNMASFAVLDATGTGVLAAGGAGWYNAWLGTFDPSAYPYLVIEVESSTGEVQFLWQGTSDGSTPDHIMIDKSDEPRTYCADLTGWSNITQFAFQNFNFSDPTIEDWGEKEKTAQETTLKITNMYYSMEPVETTPVEDAISLSTVKAGNNAPIFNLAGQQVSKAVKGVYIQNGKKFVVK